MVGSKSFGAAINKTVDIMQPVDGLFEETTEIREMPSNVTELDKVDCFSVNDEVSHLKLGRAAAIFESMLDEERH